MAGLLDAVFTAGSQGLLSEPSTTGWEPQMGLRPKMHLEQMGSDFISSMMNIGPMMRGESPITPEKMLDIGMSLTGVGRMPVGSLGALGFHVSPKKFNKFKSGQQRELGQHQAAGTYFNDAPENLSTYKRILGQTGRKETHEYKADIPDKSDMLDWDAKISTLSDKVRGKLAAALPPDPVKMSSIKQNMIRAHNNEKYSTGMMEHKYNLAAETKRYNELLKDTKIPEGATGKELYQLMTKRLGSKEAASEALRKAGIKGTYFDDLDAFGSKSSVVFNPKDINILSRNGGLLKFIEDGGA